MYKLISKFKCFGDEVIGIFPWASDAIEEAQRLGMPGEEFEVVNQKGQKVAGIVCKDDLGVIKSLSSSFLV